MNSFSIENVKKCEKCEGSFGIMAQRMTCAVCSAILCENCAENQVFLLFFLIFII